MPEFKGTPGDWDIVHNCLKSSVLGKTADGRRVTVATMEAVDASNISRVGADARLIAASKDLLQACQLWDQGFIEGEEFDEQQFLRWVNANRRAARAAIAKALGEPANDSR